MIKTIYSRPEPFRVSDGIVASYNDVLEIEGTTVKNISRNITKNLDQSLINNMLGYCYGYCEEFKNITDKLHNIYVKKNHDYGDSFSQSLNKFGLIASVVRLGDKMNRLESLVKKDEQLVEDESIVDTFLDMANYCIMTAMWIGDYQDL